MWGKVSKGEIYYLESKTGRISKGERKAPVRKGVKTKYYIIIKSNITGKEIAQLNMNN